MPGKLKASKRVSTADDTPTHASAASLWSDEIWTNLLAMMSYGGLRTMERVTKCIRKLIEGDKFDEILFRVQPTKRRLTKDDKLTIHPMLDAVDCVNITTTKARILSSDAEDEITYFNAYEYPACDEFATQPACTQMIIDINMGKSVSVADRNGIKNRRIFKALGMFWNKKAPTHLIRFAVEAMGVKPEEAKMAHCLGDQRFFEGWQSATVQSSDGTVELKACCFASLQELPTSLVQIFAFQPLFSTPLSTLFSSSSISIDKRLSAKSKLRS
ncbi:hypothetical protein JCM11251_006947 [Rhodosporidiobolus azoricus]